jgi:secreted Zn-dependent insulinase-like peptidase
LSQENDETLQAGTFDNLISSSPAGVQDSNWCHETTFTNLVRSMKHFPEKNTMISTDLQPKQHAEREPYARPVVLRPGEIIKRPLKKSGGQLFVNVKLVVSSICRIIPDLVEICGNHKASSTVSTNF